MNHRDLRAAYAQSGDWKNALRYAKRAQDLHLNFVINDILLVQCYIKLDRLEEAEKAMINRSSYWIHYDSLHFKSIIAMAKGETELALSYIELMGKEEDIRYTELARLYFDLGMYDKTAYFTCWKRRMKIRSYPLIFLAL